RYWHMIMCSSCDASVSSHHRSSRFATTTLGSSIPSAPIGPQTLMSAAKCKGRQPGRGALLARCFCQHPRPKWGLSAMVADYCDAMEKAGRLVRSAEQRPRDPHSAEAHAREPLPTCGRSMGDNGTRMTASTMPERAGPRPEVIGPAPHAQRSQNAPAALQQELLRRARELPGVREADSGVSVPGARAFVLDEATALGPREAFM